MQSIDLVETYAYGMSKDLIWPEIPGHSYRMLITGGSGSVKTNALLNLIKHEPDIDKI